MIKCDECGKLFVPGNDAKGIPNGVGFVLEDGTVYNACLECIMKKGKEQQND